MRKRIGGEMFMANEGSFLNNKDQNSNKRGHTEKFVSQVIYPAGRLEAVKEHAFLVGWNSENFRCTVCCVIELPTDQLPALKEAIALTSSSEQGLMSSLWNQCAPTKGQLRAAPIVLGEWIPYATAGYQPSSEEQNESIWITLSYATETPSTQQHKQIRLHSLYSLGCRFDTYSCLFEYDPVHTDQYECLHTERESSIFSNRSGTVPPYLRHRSAVHFVDRNSVSFLNPSTESTMLHNKATDLDTIIMQLNTAEEMKHAIQYYLTTQTRHHDNSRSGRLVSSVIQSIVTASHFFFAGLIWIWFHHLRLTHRILTTRLSLVAGMKQISNWIRVSSGLHASTRSSYSHLGSDSNINKGISCCDISATAGSVAARVAHILRTFRKCGLFPHIWSFPPHLKQTIWIDVHSLIMLLIIDVGLGCAVGCFLLQNMDKILEALTIALQTFERSMIFEALEWFNHSPGGVKLNPLITKNIGAILRFWVSSYDSLLLMSRPVHSWIFRIVACSGALGISVQLMMVVDLIRLLTAHIALLFHFLGLQHRHQLHMIYSLWLLFRGMKVNVLRNRIDSFDYDSSLLLIGMMLFCTVIFFFPNFAVFFYLFAFVQGGNIVVQAVLMTMSVTIIEFPYYKLLLRVRWPRILTDGILFRPICINNLAVCDLHNHISPGQSQRDGVAAEGLYSLSTTSEGGENFSLLKKSWRGLRKGMSSCAVPTTLTCESFCDDTAEPSLPLLDTEAFALTSTIDVRQVRSTSTKSSRRVSFQSADDCVVQGSPNSKAVDTMSLLTPYIRNSIQSDVQENGSRGIRKSSSLNDTYSSNSKIIGNRKNDIKDAIRTVHHEIHDASQYENISMRIMAQRIPIRKLFESYVDYMNYFGSCRMCKQMIKGAICWLPSIDSELIHAVTDIVDKRQLAEVFRMEQLFRKMPRPRDTVETKQLAAVAKFAVFEELLQFGYVPRATFWDIIRSASLIGEDFKDNDHDYRMNAVNDGSDFHWANANAKVATFSHKVPVSSRNNSAKYRFVNPLRKPHSRYLLLMLLITVTVNMLLCLTATVILFHPNWLPLPADLESLRSRLGIQPIREGDASPSLDGHDLSLITDAQYHDERRLLDGTDHFSSDRPCSNSSSSNRRTIYNRREGMIDYDKLSPVSM